MPSIIIFLWFWIIMRFHDIMHNVVLPSAPSWSTYTGHISILSRCERFISTTLIISPSSTWEREKKKESGEKGGHVLAIMCLLVVYAKSVCIWARYRLTLFSGLLRTHATFFYNVLTAVQLIKLLFGCLLRADMGGKDSGLVRLKWNVWMCKLANLDRKSASVLRHRLV